MQIYEGKFACMQFKSSSIVRDWDYDKMIEVADRICKEHDMPVLIMGNGFYRDLINEHIAGFKERFGRDADKRIVNLTNMFQPEEGKEGLRFLYSSALIAHAAFIVTVDSALVHVAGGTYTPSISLYGPFPGKIRTLYYPRNITLEKPEGCEYGPCLIHTRSGDGENRLPVDTCKPTDEENPFYHCRMMNAIEVEDVMEAIKQAESSWGSEGTLDRKRLVRARESWGRND